MPEISRFLGISVRMFRERPAILEGRLPPRILGYVVEWAAAHQEDLLRCWQAAQTDRPVGKIQPLV